MESWDLFAISQVEHRRGFHGQLIDCHLTRSVFSNLSPADQRLILLNVIGGFQTQVIKAKWCHTESIHCPLCKAVDNQQHRFLECTALTDVRTAHPEAVEILSKDRPQWIYNLLAQKSPYIYGIHKILSSLPPVSHSDVEIPNFSHLRFYTDGACSNPTIPHLRVSSWSVVCDMTPDEAFRVQVAQTISDHVVQTQWMQCVPTGITSGFQSAARGELMAVVETCKLANKVETCRHVTIVTDAQYVINVVAIIRLGILDSVLDSMANPDLVLCLRNLLREKNYHFVKVQSHRQFHEATSWLDLWDILGNHFADMAATAARQKLPNDLQEMINDALIFYKLEHKRINLVLEYFIDLNKFRADSFAALDRNHNLGQTDMSNPLDNVLGDELIQVLSDFSPLRTIHIDLPPLTPDIAQCFLQGSHTAYYLHAWLQLLVWPADDISHEPPASWGFRFLSWCTILCYALTRLFPLRCPVWVVLQYIFHTFIVMRWCNHYPRERWLPRRFRCIKQYRHLKPCWNLKLFLRCPKRVVLRQNGWTSKGMRWEFQFVRVCRKLMKPCNVSTDTSNLLKDPKPWVNQLNFRKAHQLFPHQVLMSFLQMFDTVHTNGCKRFDEKHNVVDPILCLRSVQFNYLCGCVIHMSHDRIC